MYWLNRLETTHLVKTDEAGKVIMCIPFGSVHDLFSNLLDWAAGYSRPEEWYGDYFAQMRAEGAEPEEIEAVRNEIAEDLRRDHWYPFATIQEILDWFRERHSEFFPPNDSAESPCPVQEILSWCRKRYPWFF